MALVVKKANNVQGMDMEIYVCKYVSRAFIGLSYADVLEVRDIPLDYLWRGSFSQIEQFLCANHRTLLLGLVSKGVVILNPGPRTAITESTKLIVIAPVRPLCLLSITFASIAAEAFSNRAPNT